MFRTYTYGGRKLKICSILQVISRGLSYQHKPGLILGVYESTNDATFGKFSEAAKKVNSQIDNKLDRILTKCVHKKLKVGKSIMIHGLEGTYPSIAVVCCGSEAAGFNEKEERDDQQENIRIAIASGVRLLKECGVTDIDVDPITSPIAAAEGATLSLFSYEKLKKKDNEVQINVQCLRDDSSDSLSLLKEWEHGIITAEGQNFSRSLTEAPANYMTPTMFYDTLNEIFAGLPIKLHKREKQWIENQKMGAFLSVAKGSPEPPLFIELDYNGGGEGTPVALVGKGVTFDSGGISLKSALNMDQMRGDMGGAACIAGGIYAAAKLQLPVSIKGFIALCENMPSGTATRPGDVVTARNGKTIQVTNTDAEGRLLLADTLNYAETANPSSILSIATLTGAIRVALGSAVTGAFTTSPELWKNIHRAGAATGDRLWRMPLFEHYTKQMTKCHLADIDNQGPADGAGGACKAAAFLKEFVTHPHWMHLDIAGVVYNSEPSSYLSKGMTGFAITIVTFTEVFLIRANISTSVKNFPRCGY